MVLGSTYTHNQRRPNLQGLFVDGGARPKSKKQVKELISTRPEAVYVEATSVFGNEYQGAAAEMPVGTEAHFVGPDPFTDRRFYGTLVQTAKGLRIR